MTTNWFGMAKEKEKKKKLRDEPETLNLKWASQSIFLLSVSLSLYTSCADQAQNRQGNERQPTGSTGEDARDHR